MELTILEIEFVDDGVSLGRVCEQETILAIKISHGDEKVLSAPKYSLNFGGKLSVLKRGSSNVSCYTIEISQATESVGTFRVPMNSLDGVQNRLLRGSNHTMAFLRFRWQKINSQVDGALSGNMHPLRAPVVLQNQTIFSSWLRGAYLELFSGQVSSSEYAIRPTLLSEKLLFVRENVIRELQSDDSFAPIERQNGALFLTSLRIIFIRDFVNVQSLIESTIGQGEQEKSLDEILGILIQKGVTGDLASFIKGVDKNGDGKLSGDELGSFIAGKLRCTAIVMPIQSIAQIKLPKRLEKAESETSENVHFFEAETIDASVISYELLSGQTIFSIECRIPALLRKWVVIRRFSEFAKLHRELSHDVLHVANIPPLPRKSFFTSPDLEERRKDLNSFVKALLVMDVTRTKVLADFLDAATILRDIQKKRTLEEEGKKTSMMNTVDRVTSALIDGQPKSLAVHQKESQQKILISDKLGFQATFLVPSVPPPEMSAVEWCESVQAEINWLVIEADFPAAMKTKLRSGFPSGTEMMRAEYSRFGILERGTEGVISHDTKWRIVSNFMYQYCESYPALFAIPSSIDDDHLVLAASQRSKNRLPALCWMHPETHVPLCRSAQPMAGLKGGPNEKTLKEDVDVLVAIRDTVPGSTLKIVDARPLLNASANALAGKGYENIDDIPGSTTIDFMDIDNIHAMRSSFEILTEACRTDSDDFIHKVAESKWLLHVKQVIRGGYFIASSLQSRFPVLVHCSDGWDRTSQLSAVGQILIDPFYRTFGGFVRIIEKDFCSFGHMFSFRSDTSSKEYSPVFLQFLDVVFQLQFQFPQAFEFNEHFLIFIADGFYSGYSVTFLGNCEREREKMLLHFGKGPTAWELTDFNDYRNSCYHPTTALVELLRPKFTMQAMQIWSSLYMRKSFLGLHGTASSV